MKVSKKRPNRQRVPFTRSSASRAAVYSTVYEQLKPVARHHGYALALHGSMTRDLDLIAVAWTENASRPQKLVNALSRKLSGMVGANNPTMKPHRRLAWVILFGGSGAYIDLSIIPPDRWQ